MEILIIAGTLIGGFALFIVVIYVVAKLFFSKGKILKDRYTPVAKKGLLTGNRNPYSFPTGNG